MVLSDMEQIYREKYRLFFSCKRYCVFRTTEHLEDSVHVRDNAKGRIGTKTQ